MDSDEIDLVALWRLVWSYKVVVVSSAIFGATAALALALTSPPIFRAQVLVTPVRDDDMSAAAGYANRLGGLATLAGINLSQGGGDVALAKAVLNSRNLAEEFIRQQNIASQLVSEDRGQSTMWFAVNRFRDEILDIREDPQKSATVVTVDWTDPEIAAAWANAFVGLANEFIRERARAGATRNVEYLNSELAKTNVVELRRAIYSLIESETKTLMLANARVEYAFTVVDPAVIPRQKVYPQRSLMVLIGGAIGGVVGLIIAFVHRLVAGSRSGG